MKDIPRKRIAIVGGLGNITTVGLAATLESQSRFKDADYAEIEARFKDYVEPRRAPYDPSYGSLNHFHEHLGLGLPSREKLVDKPSYIYARYLGRLPEPGPKTHRRKFKQRKSRP